MLCRSLSPGDFLVAGRYMITAIKRSQLGFEADASVRFTRDIPEGECSMSEVRMARHSQHALDGLTLHCLNGESHFEVRDYA